MKFFKDLINEISREELIEYYITQNHSYKECMEHWEIGGSLFARLLKYFNIKKDKDKHSELIAKTKLDTYGSSTYNNRRKAEQTCLERYGVKNPFQDKELIKQSYLKAFNADHPMHKKEVRNKATLNHDYKKSIEKAKQTYFENTGFDNPGKNPRAVKKGIQTKILNGVFDSAGSSNIEKRLYKILQRKFENVIWHYRDERYARESGYMFECDFYVPDLDLFIELNAAYYHGNCQFNKDNAKHIELAEQLKNSAKKWENDKYNTWCIKDVEKQNIAKQNKLHYLQLYPENSIFNNQQINDKQYSELINYLIKKLNGKID